MPSRSSTITTGRAIGCSMPWRRSRRSSTRRIWRAASSPCARRVVHTYGAEWNWYLRWVGTSPTGFPDASAFPDVATIRAAWRAQEQKVRLLVSSSHRRTSWIACCSYRTFDGQEMESAFSPDAAARREPCDVSPRPGDDHAAPARSARSEAAGSDQVLPGTREQSSLSSR